MEQVLVLRTCGENMKSQHNGFTWPKSGYVAALDWLPTKQCGNGLHGFLWGEGDGDLANWDPSANWLVVKVNQNQIINLDGKVKFPEGEVVFCGDRKGATEYLAANGGSGKAIIGYHASAGNQGTATAGYRGTATAGNGGTATAGYRGIASAGYKGTASAGDYGIASAGDYGIASAGDFGTASAGNGGTATAGYRGTASAGYGGTASAGDNGIASAGDFGTASAGYGGTASAGYGGTAIAGDYGTASAGYKGILQIKWYDGQRYRISTAYVGENDIFPNTKYKLDEKGQFQKV